MAQYNQALRDPARRDPRVFVMSSDQADFPTVTKFINTLRYIGVEVHQANAQFSANGKNYPAQFLRHQDRAIGTRARASTCSSRRTTRTTWTNAVFPVVRTTAPAGRSSYQMGIKFDRLFDDVTGQFTEIQGLAKPVPGTLRHGTGGT